MPAQKRYVIVYTAHEVDDRGYASVKHRGAMQSGDWRKTAASFEQWANVTTYHTADVYDMKTGHPVASFGTLHVLRDRRDHHRLPVAINARTGNVRRAA